MQSTRPQAGLQPELAREAEAGDPSEVRRAGNERQPAPPSRPLAGPARRLASGYRSPPPLRSVRRHRCERVRMNRLPREMAGVDMATSSNSLVPMTLKSSSLSMT